MITFTEVAALAVSVEIVVTVFKQRAPGMTLDRIPLFVWSQLITAFMVIFAMPAVMMSSTLLILERLAGTHFYNPAEGGDPLLWTSNRRKPLRLPLVGILSAAPSSLHVMVCNGCHIIPGVDNATGQVGPELAGIAMRVYVAGVVPNTPDNLVRFIVDPQSIDEKTAMPRTGITPDKARDVTAYLYSIRQ